MREAFAVAALALSGLGVLGAAAPPRAPAPVPTLSAASGSTQDVVEARRVALDGTALDLVTAVRLGPSALRIVHRSASELQVVVPPSPGFVATGGRFTLMTAAGTVPTHLAYRWTASSSRARELRWAWTHAHVHRWASGHPYITGEDCANFAGRALAVRGLPAAVLQVSSTTLRRVLLGPLHERELADSPAARRRVRVGDVVQFDWWPSAERTDDRDHTGIVSSVEQGSNGSTTVRYIAHTDPGDEPQVGQTIEGSLREHGHDPHGHVFFILIR